MKVIRKLFEWPGGSGQAAAWEIDDDGTSKCRLCFMSSPGKWVVCSNTYSATEGNCYHITCILHHSNSKNYADYLAWMEVFHKFLEKEPEFGLEI